MWFIENCEKGTNLEHVLNFFVGPFLDQWISSKIPGVDDTEKCGSVASKLDGCVVVLVSLCFFCVLYCGALDDEYMMIWNNFFRYPIYHIPMGRTIKDLSTCFLNYHTLSSSFQGTLFSLSLLLNYHST